MAMAEKIYDPETGGYFGLDWHCTWHCVPRSEVIIGKPCRISMPPLPQFAVVGNSFPSK
jgi:hypothetical protein